MIRTLTSLTLGAAMILAPGLAAPAAASHSDWSFGAGFRLGGFYFSIGLGPGRYGPPAYYYRMPERLAYRGHRCDDRCYQRDGYYYHHEACPVVGYHLARYQVDRHDLFYRYAPRYDGRYGRHDGYDRYDRYDRHDRYDDRHDRYDDRRYGYDRRDDRRWQDRRYRHDHRSHRGRSCP